MFRRPGPLTAQHRIEDFDSGKPALDRFLHEAALVNQQRGFTRTVVIADRTFRVAGYYSLCAGMISRQDAPRAVGGHGAPREIPVALLARLAVDRQFQGAGLGGALLSHALKAVVAASGTVAFRAVMVHALDDDAIGFYARYGFVAAKGLERTLLLATDAIGAALETRS